MHCANDCIQKNILCIFDCFFWKKKSVFSYKMLIQFGSRYNRFMFLKKFNFRFVMKGSCLVGFIHKKVKPHNRPAPSLILHLILSSLVDSSHTSHCLSRKNHSHSNIIHRCSRVCVCVFLSSLLNLTVQLLSLSSWPSCDSQSCGFRSSKTMSGQRGAHISLNLPNCTVFLWSAAKKKVLHVHLLNCISFWSWEETLPKGRCVIWFEQTWAGVASNLDSASESLCVAVYCEDPLKPHNCTRTRPALLARYSFLFCFFLRQGRMF